MNGVVFTGGGSEFAVALAPLLDVMSDLHWHVDVQGSAWTPEDPYWRPGRGITSHSDIFASQAHGYWVPSARLYRAGVLPRFASALCASERSYYVGYGASIEEAADARKRVSPQAMGGRWVRAAPALFRLGIACVTPECGGEWAVASPEEAWLDRLRRQYECRPYDPMKEPPWRTWE